MAPLSFSCFEYYTAIIPDWATLAPSGWTPRASLAASMAMYWKWFQPNILPVVLDESVMTERQKALVALRTAITTILTLSNMFTEGNVVKAQSGTDLVEFEEKNKIYRAMMPLWQMQLKDMEAAEGIFFNLLQNIPGLLIKLDDYTGPFNPSFGYVFESGTWFVNAGDLV
jgi:hypothetical protein